MKTAIIPRSTGSLFLKCVTACLTLSASCALSGQSAAAAPAPKAPSAAEVAEGKAALAKVADPNELVELSPFVINGENETGYDSNNTLSGTRLRTPTKYLGSATFEVTKALMQDLGLFNMQDIIDFTPNASSYFGGGITNDTAGTNALFGVNYNVRGMVVSNVSRDFINFRVPDDAYNVEQFSFTRGPNSVLFGVGQAGGIVNSVSKRAMMRNRYQTTASVDTNDGHRFTADLNQVLLPKKLAIRVAALSEMAKTNRRPSDRSADRIYGSLTYSPTRSTTIRVNGESGHINALAVRPWVATDGTVAWVAAGKQEIPVNLRNGGTTAASLPAIPAGQPTRAQNLVQLATAGFETMTNTPQPVFLNNSAGAMPLLNMNAFVITGRTTMPNGDRFQSWVNNPAVPYETNVLGYGNRLAQKFGNGMVVVEQKIGDGFFVEALFNRQRTVNHNDYSSQGDLNIYMDKNPTLLTWDNRVITNPNYNRYFTYSGAGNSYLSTYIDVSARVTASYELNLEPKVSGWFGKLLGHHNFAVLRSRDSTDYIQNYAPLTNVTPDGKTPQQSALIFSQPLTGNNRPAFINYITPGEKSTYAARDWMTAFDFPNMIFSGTPLPTATDPSGVTPRYFVSTSTRSLQKVNSQMIVAQDFFWNNRIVTTFGARKDVSDLWLLPTLPDPKNPAYTIDAGTRDVKSSPTGQLEAVGYTYTQGVVAGVTNWLAVFYNRSSNFLPPSGLRQDLFGIPLPAGSGLGQDYGVKLNLMKDRMQVALSRYTTDFSGVPSSIFRGGATNLNVPLQAIITAMNNAVLGGPGGPTWAGAFPWPSGNQSYSSLNDIVSKGYEMTMSANLTRNWRTTVNFSHQKSASSNFGATERRWIAEVVKPYFAANPQYASLRTGANGPQNSDETIAQRIQDMDNIMTASTSLNGKADARQAQYTANLTTGYDFTIERLKGLGVGGSVQWRSKMILGYPYVAGQRVLFDTTKPYYSDPTLNVGAFVYYKTSLFKRQTRVQLNARNLNNDERLHPFTVLDAGNGSPLVEQYSLGPGRSFTLQVSFDL